MEGRQGGIDLLQQGRHHPEQGMRERSANQALPRIDDTATGQHDLSYLAGPPFTVPGQTGEPKRYFQGLAENANTLGISKADLLRSDAQSPFCSIINATGDYSTLPLSLQPTMIQRRYPHHPFWDCIPIPSFRDRTILAAAAMPPLINRFEVCWDLFAGGLTYSGDASAEDSWTFSTAFREKWDALLNINLAELQRQADARYES